MGLMFSFKSVVRSHHVYNDVWNSFVGKVYPAELKQGTFMIYTLLLLNEMVWLSAMCLE